MSEIAEKSQIAVDAFDDPSAGQVWHGTGETEVDPKQIDGQLLQVSVDRVLASFPIRSSGRPGVTSKQAP